jgi:hypothetical protein
MRREGSKEVFSFEKKKQKTFANLAPSVRATRCQKDRSFLLLFFKKEEFSF